VIIDAHQHFWDPAIHTFPWMTAEHAPIRRRFRPDDLRPELAANGVAATVLVQTWHSVDETKAFLTTAACTDFVAGVVGWVDLTGPRVEQSIDELMGRPDGRYLVGIRHLVHDEPDPEWLLRDDVRRGLEVLARRGLAYDLLLKSRDIPAALRTVADFSDARFVVDHIAKPNIREGAMVPWVRLMEGFRPHRGHVWCKLSGMAEEADWQAWTPDQLRPYVHEALDIFGADRCLFGSNWPVCLLAGDYGRITSALAQCVSHLSEAQRAQVMGGSAMAAYRLPGDAIGS